MADTDVTDSAATHPAVTVDTTIAALELAAAGDATTAVPERFVRTAVRAGRVSLALPQAFPMRQAHYLLRPPGEHPPSAPARAFLHWLAGLDQHQPALPGDPATAEDLAGRRAAC